MSQIAGAPCEPLELGTRFAKKFLIERVIGQGGFSFIYKASDLLTGKTVALKVLRLKQQDWLRRRLNQQRLRWEWKIGRRVAHPNLVAFYDQGITAAEDCYLVMEYIAGTPLNKALCRSRITIPQALQIGLQLTQCLDELHRVGIIHNDIKPDNVIVRDGQAKLLDFGCAKLRGINDFDPYMRGTVEYMAPERLDEQDGDSRSDIWSLGATLYQVLTCCRLFGPQNRSHHTLTERLEAVRRDQQNPPPSLRRQRADTPPQLEAIVLWMLAYEPGARPQSAEALAYHLERVLQPNYF